MALEGQQLGRYRLLSLIGRGGMGEVYLGEDSSLDRQVAIKVVRSELNGVLDTEGPRMALHLFRREARTIAMLDHPRILPLYDFGEQEMQGTLFTYLVMPYRPEGSLVTWLQKRREESGPLSLPDIEWITQQAASALQYAHDHQVVHQDVKPSNFLIRYTVDSPERPDLLLSDFGLAKLGLLGSSASQSIRGTPTYMAPEQWEGRVHAATDQYALAVMAYELLTGRSPFMGTPMQMMYAHVNTQPRPPSVLDPRLPQSIDTALGRALAKRPEARFPSVLAFAFALRQALRGAKGAIPLRASTPGFTPSLSTIRPDRSAPNDRYVTMPIDQGQLAGASLPTRGHVRESDSRAAQAADVAQWLPSTPATTPPVTPMPVSGQAIHVPPQGRGAAASATGEKPAYHATLAGASSHPSPMNTAAQRGEERGVLPLVSSLSGRFSAVVARNSQVMQAVITQRRASRKTAALLIACGLLLILGGYLLVNALLGHISGQANNPGTIAIAQQSATAQARASASATAIAQQNATATAVAARANPYPQAKGTLVLNDPLRDNTQGHQWQEYRESATGNGCQFVNGAYHVTMKAGSSGSCLAQAARYGDFTYQAQMVFVRSGQAYDSGGLVFRANGTTFYYFEIFESGRYVLGVCANNTCARTFSEGLAQAIPSFHAGLNQVNTIAVVARGNTFTLYVNNALVAGPVTDPAATSSQGAIGLWCTAKDATTEVAYSNVKVWA